MKKQAGNLTTGGCAAILLGFGIVYLLRGSFLPYHSEAVSMKWEELSSSMQYLLLALMRAAAGGFITVSVAMIFLQYKFHREKISWIPTLIMALGTITMLCLLYAVLTVSHHTPGHPPLLAIVLGELLLLTGYIFNRRNVRKNIG